MLVGLFLVATFVLGLHYLQSSVVRAFPDPAARPTPTPRKSKYSEFPHDIKAHRTDCSNCHKFPSSNWNKVRTGPGAFADITDYPKHDSCVKCHMQQFFKGAQPAICSICHTNPSPRDSSRHPFPNPREIFDQSAKGKTAESDFVVGFPHDKHVDIVAGHSAPRNIFTNASFSYGRQTAETSCAVCHNTLSPQGASPDEYITKPPADLGDGFWVKKGMFKSAPTGHANCFTCHSTESGILPAPNNCAACHQIRPAQAAADFDAKFAATIGIDNKIMMDAWRLRDSSGKFGHEFFAHVELSCSTCHNVNTMNTVDLRTKKVGIASCATCHVTASVDEGGVLNFEIESRRKDPAFQCAKCHTMFGKLPVPDSHTRALAEGVGK